MNLRIRFFLTATLIPVATASVMVPQELLRAQSQVGANTTLESSVDEPTAKYDAPMPVEARSEPVGKPLPVPPMQKMFSKFSKKARENANQNPAKGAQSHPFGSSPRKSVVGSTEAVTGLAPISKIKAITTEQSGIVQIDATESLQTAPVSTLIQPAGGPVTVAAGSIVAAQGGQGTAPAVPQNQSSGTQSEVQKQLEALYQKDGKKMPTMNINELPQQPPAGAAAAPPSGVPAGAPATPSQPSLLNRFFGSGTKPAATRQVIAPSAPSGKVTPPQVYRPAPAAVNSAPATAAQAAPVYRPAPAQVTPAPAVQAYRPAPPPATTVYPPVYSQNPPTAAPARVSVQPLQRTPAQARPQVQFVQQPRQLPQQRLPAQTLQSSKAARPVPSAVVQSVPVLTAAPQSEQSDIPRLDLDEPEENGTQQPKAITPAIQSTRPGAAQPLAVPDSEANRRPVAQPAESSPFSGLKLQTPDQADLPALKDVPTVEEKIPAAFENHRSARDAEVQSHSSMSPSQHTGFKGFCPVSVYHRKLIKTKPEFSSEYNSRVYHFASAEAKAEFDKAPIRYVPVGDGIDVVIQLEDEERVEGSLDYAAWYQGRLYMFSNQANLSVFHSGPADYSEEELIKAQKAQLKDDADVPPESDDFSDEDDDEPASKAEPKVEPKAINAEPQGASAPPAAAPQPNAAPLIKSNGSAGPVITPNPVRIIPVPAKALPAKAKVAPATPAAATPK